jgi:hypothetical protein
VKRKWEKEGALVAQGKCTKQFALIAARNAKCLSSLQETDQSTAGNASENTRNSDFLIFGENIQIVFFIFFIIFILIKTKLYRAKAF